MDEVALHELFARQHGVARDQQVLDIGMTRRTLGRRLQSGVFRRVTPGVVARAGQRRTFEARSMAAQLLLGERSFLDGPTAGAMYGLRRMARSPVWASTDARIHVDVPAWIRASTRTWVDSGDVTSRGPFRIASPTRMLLTLAATTTPDRFEQIAEDAWHLGLATPGAIRTYVERVRRPGRRGVGALDKWLETVADRRRPAQSGLELDVISAIRAAGLPEPTRQHPVVLGDASVVHLDVAWPDVRLAVEPGHSWWHGGDAKMHADQARDRACGEQGWHVVRLDESLASDLAAVGAQLARIHGARAARLRG